MAAIDNISAKRLNFNNICKKMLIMSASLLLPLSIFAIPAKPGLVKMQGADGKYIDVQIVGNEYFHYYLSADGRLLIPRDGRMCYAEPGEFEIPETMETATSPMMKGPGTST